MAKLFATGIVLSIFTACGGQTDVGGPAGSLNLGGSASSAGGSTATSTNITAGGTSASTGSSAAIDVNTYCNGLLAGALVCDLEQFVNVSSCDFPLQRSPPDPAVVEAAIDCLRIFQVKPDAGISGFHIDYSQNPAHLVLTGEYCDIMLRNGAQNVVVVQGCSCPC